MKFALASMFRRINNLRSGFAALPAGGIQILPVKGCWLKEQYPDIDYRQMSDLDILIHEEDALRAKNAMAELGYTAQEEETAENHDCYGKPPYLEVELHRSLLEKNDDRYGYYLDVWEKAEPVADCAGMFRLKAEDEYIYYLLHLYKHVVASGTGLRTILDCLVYRNVYPDMDRAYLRKEWKKLELTEFAQQIETLSDCWFKTGTPVPEQLERLASTIMAAGSYGNFEIFRDQKLEGLQQKYKNPFIRALMYWVSLICRPREEMERQYPIVKKLPVLLPVFWIVRAVGKFASRPKAVLHHVKSVFGRVKKDD